MKKHLFKFKLNLKVVAIVLWQIVAILYTKPIHSQTDQAVALSKRIQQKISKTPLDLSLSGEYRIAHRTRSAEQLHDGLILNELRFQIASSYYGDWYEIRGKIDLGYDQFLGEPLVDLRNLNVDIYPQNWWSLKIGRQILTWGKGDFLFINDLFPKDFPSFFSGRDINYLKAPNNAIKLNITPSWLQINLVYIPQFDPDRFLTGERISFFDTGINMFRGSEHQLPHSIPNEYFKDDEWHLRLQKAIGSASLALYAYQGNWKSPAGYDQSKMAYVFPQLAVYGMSFESPMLKGILSTEFGYYRSKNDLEGLDFLIRNSELRWLLGYSRDIKPNWTVGVQFYNEYVLNYDAYLSTFSGGVMEDEFYDILTLSIRKTVNKQRTAFELFTFFSFQDEDAYLRPSLTHSINDYWKISCGGNLFLGKQNTTFWNQFEFNNNLYLGIKWNI